MEAIELRIGNIVQCDKIGDTYTDRKPYYGKYIFEIIGVFSHSVNLDLGFGATQTIDISCIEHIPITEDWLIKFGFVNIGKMGGCLAFEKCKIKILHDIRNDQDIYSVCISTVSPATWAICEIKHAHQLQNIYFAITGEELTIK